MSKQLVGVEGAKDVQNLLSDLLPKTSDNIMRATVLGMASDIGKQIRASAPEGETGTIKKAIKWRKGKMKKDGLITAVVYITGDATKPKDQGATKNAFYWRFVEYGTEKSSPQPFVQPVANKARSESKQILEENFVKKVKSAAKRAQKNIK